MAVSIVLLSYKEEENLRILLPEIKTYADMMNEEYEIIVIDTEKPFDNTEEVCEEYNARYINQRYPNFGGAFRTAIEEAAFDKFLIMDSDGSHNPKYIPEIYNSFLSGADLVIGSRYISGGKTNDAVSSVIMSRILNTVYRVVIGVRAKDISTDYRMYDTLQLKGTSLKCRNYEVLQEVIMQMKINNPNLVIKEIPIEFNKRMFGESKRKLLEFSIGYLKNIFRLLNMRFSITMGRN